MRDFFSLDGAFNKYGGLVADTIILSLMWFLFSIPLVTIGASTSALFYVTTMRIAEREGYVTSDFWFAFKANFKRGTIVWAMIVALIALIIFNLLIMEVVGNMSMIVMPIQIVVLVQVALMCVYIFPLVARFDMGIKEILKSAFFMANRHLLTSITCAALGAALVLGIFLFQPLIIGVPGIYAMISSYMIMRIFKKYRPEMDKDPVLEIQELEAKKAEERRLQGISMLEEEPANTDTENAAEDTAEQ